MAFNDVFFFLLGGTAWILVNGIYAQIPYIVIVFDGDYGVVSKITLCVTLSSLVPILLSVSFSQSLHRVPTTSSSKGTNDRKLDSSKRSSMSGTSLITDENQDWYIDIGIGVMLSIGLMTALTLTIWTEWVTSHFFPLMATVIAGGIVGSASSILYYPHAATTTTPKDGVPSTTTSVVKRQTTALLFGTATSNLFVAILSILQQEIRRRINLVRVYFGIITILMGLGITGFIGTLMIRFLYKTESECNEDNTDDLNSISEQSSLLKTRASNDDISSMSSEYTRQSQTPQKMSHDSLSFWEITYLNSTLNAAQFFLNALTFFLPGIVPYSVLKDDNEKKSSSDALQYLIVFQLVAQSLGVLASSSHGNGAGQNFLYKEQHLAAGYQLASFFLLLWIPMVSLSLKHQKNFGIGVPIFFNTFINFAYCYCNTSWFHMLVHDRNQQHHYEHHHSNEGRGDSFASIILRDEMKHLNGVSTMSSVRVMGTWHQIGATIGSAIAFGLIQSTNVTKAR